MERHYTNYAFISYKREDERWAKWIQRKLENYRLPSIIRKQHIQLPQYIRPVFRDSTDLSGGILADRLNEELMRSKFLIVVCSPQATQSEWINKEVQSFIDDGRLGNIIPFIVDGEPHSSDPMRECFPKSLLDVPVEQELLGINVGEVGKNRAFVRLVAMMLGVQFDLLWQRHKRRAAVRRTWIIVACLLLCAACIAAFDFFRTKTEYYADYVVCRGMPVGVLPLKKNEVGRYYSYYRFESSQRKLNRVVHCNFTGKIIDHSNTAMTDRYAIQEIGYENGVFNSVTMRNALNIPVYKEVYNPPYYDKVDLKNIYTGDASNFQGSYTSISSLQQEKEKYFNLAELMSMGKAKIGRYVIEYDDEGYAIRKLFKRYNGDNSHVGKDNNGVCGFSYVRDELHRVTELYYLDENGDVAADRNGVVGRKYGYDDNGIICSENFIGDDDGLVLNELHYAHSEIKADPARRLIDEYHYGIDGTPCLNRYGYHHAQIKFSADSLVVTFFGVSDKAALYWDPVMGVGGYHMIAHLLDKEGCVKSTQYFGVDSVPVFVQPGYNKVVYVNGKDGLPVRTIAYDTKGRKVNLSTYVCEIESKYADGKIAEMIYYDNRGKRVNSIFGYSRMVSSYENGKLVDRKYYDYSDVPAVSAEILGTHELQIEYDDGGNAVMVSMLSANGDLAMCSNGFARARMKYDESGNCVQYVLYDTDDEPVAGVNGVAMARNIYNEEGLLVRQSLYGADGVPAISSMGYSIEEFGYDRYGMVVERRTYDADGNPVVNNYGWAKMKMEYKNNRLVAEATYDADGNPSIDKTAGCYKARYEYDSRGYAIATTLWDVADRPMQSVTTGFWKVEQKHNFRGQLEEECYYGIDGNLKNNSYGVARSVNKYSDQGFIVEQRYYDKDGNLAVNKYPGVGFAYSVMQYNERGQLLSFCVYGVDGEPVNNGSGIHKMSWVYGEDGALLMLAYYDKDGKLCNGAMGPVYCAMQKSVFNDYGDLIYIVSYDADREVLSEQYSRFDDNGNSVGYFRRYSGLLYEMDLKGNMKCYYPLSLDDSTERMVDSINHMLDSIGAAALTMYE